ncbi:hypothetical protein, partial [Nocardia sp. NPDC004722]
GFEMKLADNGELLLRSSQVMRGSIARTSIAAARESLLRTSSSGGEIGSAALALSDITLDGVASACDAVQRDGRVDLSGIPAAC